MRRGRPPRPRLPRKLTRTARRRRGRAAARPLLRRAVLVSFLGNLGRGGRPLRIGYGRVFHEANAYSPLSTTREDFERMHSLEGEALAQAASLRGSELPARSPR